MFARNTHDSFEFRLEALEARALLSGAPIPDASEATLLNGQHPVADASFLNPSEDWTVAQPGHDSGPPPFLTDNDMYDFGDVQTSDDGYDDAWANYWDSMTEAEFDEYFGDSGADYSGITGLPAAATQHLHTTEVPGLQFNAPMPLDAVVPNADAIVPVEPVVSPPTTVLPIPELSLTGTDAASTFVDASQDRNAFDPDAPLYTFGAKNAKKASVVSSFVGASDQPLSADLIGLPLIV